MAKKRQVRRYSMKYDRQLIAMAKAGASLTDAAANLRTSAARIQRMARRLGIRLNGLPAAGQKTKVK